MKRTWMLALLCCFLLAACGDEEAADEDGPIAAEPAPAPAPKSNVAGDSKERVARKVMGTFGAAIDNYRMANRKLPASLEDLAESSAKNPHPFIDSIPADPWGNPYEYRIFDRSTYEVRSYGEDGVPDTEDDLRYPKR